MSELRQPGEQLPLLPGHKTMPEAVSEPQGGPEYRYSCGLTADEIVAPFITFATVEVPAG